MKVTESGFNNRQLYMEDYLQMVSAEQKENAEVLDYSRIAEKSGVITDYWTDNLLELILRTDNLNRAYKKVKSNKGIGGIDRMQVDELLPYLRENQETSENSFGFRPKRGAHDALRQCQKNVNEGYVYVVDMDLEKFFDTVCQSKLIEVLSRTIKDGRVISLVHKYLNAGVIANGMFERTEIGMPQGGLLSPLLSNIMLNELADRQK